MIHWKSFIKNKFYNTDRKINDDVIEKLIHLTEGHPFYTQHLCHTIWDLCEKGEDVTDVFIDKAVTILLEREKYAYTTLWESLTLNQRLFLKGLAKSTIIKPFSSEFIKENKLKTPSNAQRASEGLIKMDIIDHENGNFIILDRFFKLWIKRL